MQQQMPYRRDGAVDQLDAVDRYGSDGTGVLLHQSFSKYFWKCASQRL